LAMQVEVYERYGQLFEELRGTRTTALCFGFITLLNSVVPSVLLGIQKGAGMAPSSTAAKAANTALLCAKGLYALALTGIWPFSSMVVVTAEVSSSVGRALRRERLVGREQ
jgi:hypothetical protein